jgi:hypothetical protein
MGATGRAAGCRAAGARTARHRARLAASRQRRSVTLPAWRATTRRRCGQSCRSLAALCERAGRNRSRPAARHAAARPAQAASRAAASRQHPTPLALRLARAAARRPARLAGRDHAALMWATPRRAGCASALAHSAPGNAPGAAAESLRRCASELGADGRNRSRSRLPCRRSPLSAAQGTPRSEPASAPGLARDRLRRRRSPRLGGGCASAAGA